MPDDAPRPSRHAGYASAEPTRPPNWHGLVAWDILFNNLTTGLYLVTAIAELARPGIFLPLTRYAYPLTLALLTADLLCLVFDLGDPLRFHHMLRVFKLSSPMSLGTWCLTFYSLPLTLLVAFDLLGLHGWVRTVAVVVGVPFALGSAAYKGVLFSTTAQPGWRDARWLGGFLVSAALMLGAMELLVLAALMGREDAVARLRIATGALIVLNLIPTRLLLAELGPTMRRVKASWRDETLYIAQVGIVLPLAWLFLTRGLASVLVAAASLFVASYLIRHALVMLPHSIHDHGSDGSRPGSDRAH
jgi:hypothetical protein